MAAYIGSVSVKSISLGGTTATKAALGGNVFWEDNVPTDNPLRLTAKSANATVALSAVGDAPSLNLEYSTDEVNWSPFVVGTTTVTLANIDDYVCIRATKAGNTRTASSDSKYNQFVVTGTVAASGSVNSLLDWRRNANPALPSTCFNSLFRECTGLTTAPELPSTTLAGGCYQSMFRGCTSLTTPPQLPARTMASWCYSNMFQGCTSLTTPPVLPATTLASNCYHMMFTSCTSLVTAPTLPATTLADNCYKQMFQSCTSLTTPPALSATTLDASCYYSMFNGCTSLTTAPALPATTLASSCYQGMFSQCSGMTSAPALPATTLATDCYKGMFQGCTSLTTAPALPGTTLATGCYQSMFWSTGLTSAPELPATALVTDCYKQMFYNCSGLSSITLGYTGNFSDDYFSNWVYNVAASGELHYAGADTTVGTSAIPSGWTVVAPAVPSPLCFTSRVDNSSLRLDKVGTPDAISLETSTDGTNWSDYGWTDNTGDTLTMAKAGDKVYFRAKNENQTISKAANKYYNFVVTSGGVDCSGNIQSLLNSRTERTDAPNYCYYQLFYLDRTKTDMSRIYEPPELPATTLGRYCYGGMFLDSNICHAPELPATTLSTGCYAAMFAVCPLLHEVKVGFSDWGTQNATGNWLLSSGYAGLSGETRIYYGRIICPNGLSSETGNDRVPEGWMMYHPDPNPWLCFNAETSGATIKLNKVGTPGDISIETSTDGTTWTDYGWTNKTGDTITLTNIGDKVYFRAKNENQTLGSSSSNYYRFVGTGKLAATGNIQSLLKADCSRTDAPAYCYYSLMQNGTIWGGSGNWLRSAPELPATTLGAYCYAKMFNNQTTYNTVKTLLIIPRELPATTLSEHCYD